MEFDNPAMKRAFERAQESRLDERRPTPQELEESRKSVEGYFNWLRGKRTPPPDVRQTKGLVGQEAMRKLGEIQMDRPIPDTFAEDID